MKTTIEIPDPLFRIAKSQAAAHGQTLKELFVEALRVRLSSNHASTSAREPAWMGGFGGLRHLSRETARVQARIAETFDVIEPEDRI